MLKSEISSIFEASCGLWRHVQSVAQIEVHWNVTLWRVIAPSKVWSLPRTDCIPRVGLLESAILMGGKFLPKLNISRRPIAHKYREGNVKRTLKRELKVFETVKE